MWEIQLGCEVWELRRVLACQEPGELQALEKEASLLGIDRRRSPRSIHAKNNEQHQLGLLDSGYTKIHYNL